MDILTAVVYVILFIIVMVFVFSIGMLRPFMPKKEVVLVLLCAFIIGCLGGAFFLSPLYEEVPEVVSTIEKVIPSNNETMYLDISSASDIDGLKENLTHMEGVYSFEVTGVTFYMWKFTDKEFKYVNSVIPNINSHYENFTVNQSGKIDINFDSGYDYNEALKSFSNWYGLVYGGTMSYAQLHIKVVLASSSVDSVKEYLLERSIVPSKMEGPIQDSINQTNDTMLSNNEFVVASGGIGVIVALMGIYFDNVVVIFRKLNRSIKNLLNKGRKR